MYIPSTPVSTGPSHPLTPPLRHFESNPRVFIRNAATMPLESLTHIIHKKITQEEANSVSRFGIIEFERDLKTPKERSWL